MSSPFGFVRVINHACHSRPPIKFLPGNHNNRHTHTLTTHTLSALNQHTRQQQISFARTTSQRTLPPSSTRCAIAVRSADVSADVWRKRQVARWQDGWQERCCERWQSTDEPLCTSGPPGNRAPSPHPSHRQFHPDVVVPRRSSSSFHENAHPKQVLTPPATTSRNSAVSVFLWFGGADCVACELAPSRVCTARPSSNISLPKSSNSLATLQRT
jgi:hypothetical protein